MIWTKEKRELTEDEMVRAIALAWCLGYFFFLLDYEKTFFQFSFPKKQNFSQNFLEFHSLACFLH